MIPEDLKYTEQHEWIRIDGNVATVGITDHAQEALGDLTFVEIPPQGKEVAKGEEVCAIESAKAASAIYAPAGGKVVEANEEIEGAPELVNSDPYGKGWVCKLELTDPSEADTLMDAAAYEQFLASEPQQ
jgi:glycine cleavage system H protein